jgi:hypothetical protein
VREAARSSVAGARGAVRDRSARVRRDGLREIESCGRSVCAQAGRRGSVGLVDQWV